MTRRSPSDANELLQAAVRYAELGYQVFPCKELGKSPLTRHGFHEATTDLDQVERWWTESPNANIGLSTQGLVAIDIDRRDAPWDEAKMRSLAATVISITPRRGSHRIFRQPPGKAWRCTTSAIAPNVDTRADGGYIVVPPSRTEHGEYRWLEGCELDVPPQMLPEPPEWMCELLDRAKKSVERAELPADSARIGEGRRSDTLFRLGCAMRRYGMTQEEILAALCRINIDRCDPPLLQREVATIARSASRYSPDEIAAAMARGEWKDMTYQPANEPRSLASLRESHPKLRDELVWGLLRRGEIMNLVSAPKRGKSWLAIDLAISVASGTQWLETFHVEQGNVLIFDNELHPETIAHRIPIVARCRNVPIERIENSLFVQTMRGAWKHVFELREYFERIERNRFSLVILDALYRLMPRGEDENDNGTMANIYNAIDQYAEMTGASFVLVHHTSKGVQAAKSITDVGSGAGCQSRAADTHAVLRPHEEDDVAVFEAAARSFPPPEKLCLRWCYPVWMRSDEHDPGQLRGQPRAGARTGR